MGKALFFSQARNYYYPQLQITPPLCKNERRSLVLVKKKGFKKFILKASTSFRVLELQSAPPGKITWTCKTHPSPPQPPGEKKQGCRRSSTRSYLHRRGRSSSRVPSDLTAILVGSLLFVVELWLLHRATVIISYRFHFLCSCLT